VTGVPDEVGGRQGDGVPGPPWQDLLEEAHRRIKAFVMEGSTRQLMNEDALLLAERLWTSSRDDGGAVPIEAAVAVADLYWQRSMAAPRPPGDDEDLGAAISIYAMIAAADEEAVPEELRPAVAEARRYLEAQEPSPGRSVAVARAIDLLLAAETAYDEATVEEAIAKFRALLRDDASGAGTDDDYRPVILSNLGLALRLHAVASGSPEEADEAVDLAQRALEAAGDTADRAALLGNIAVTLGTRFSWTGADADLRGAIDAGRQAVDATDQDDPAWPGRATNLSGLLRMRFDAGGTQEDLDQAIALSRKAAELPTEDVAWHSLRWSNVSNAMAAQFDLRRDPADLDAAIAAGRQAVAATSAGPAPSGAILTNLANLLLTRFEQWGGLEDLDEAIRLGQAGLSAGQAGGPARASLMSNLANMYRSRYEQHGEPRDLDQALAMSQGALSLTGPDDPYRASRLSNRAMVLLTRHERLHDPAILEEAIQAGREAVASVGSDNARRSKYLSNLALLLSARASSGTAQTSVSDLGEAVEAAQSAVSSLEPDDPARAIRLVNLAGTLLDRSRVSITAQADRQAAMGFYRQAAAMPTAAVSVRVQAARSQADLARQIPDLPSALEGYTEAIALLGRLVTRGITRRSREELLTRNRLIASEAACALSVGYQNVAVELLEQGRAVLWSQTLESAPESALAEARPDLAERLAAIAITLS